MYRPVVRLRCETRAAPDSLSEATEPGKGLIDPANSQYWGTHHRYGATIGRRVSHRRPAG